MTLLVEQEVLTVVLVDDHQLFSRGLELLLNTDPESRVRVLARTEDAGRAVELVRRHQPKVAIIDLVMPPPGGLAAVEAVKRHYPQVRVLALSGNDDVSSAVDALRAGADGFLLKSSEPDELVPPLIALASGVSVLPPPVLGALLDAKSSSGQARLADLCPEDLHLLRLVAAGLESTGRSPKHPTCRSARPSVWWPPCSAVSRCRTGSRRPPSPAVAASSRRLRRPTPNAPAGVNAANVDGRGTRAQR